MEPPRQSLDWRQNQGPDLQTTKNQHNHPQEGPEIQQSMFQSQTTQRLPISSRDPNFQKADPNKIVLFSAGAFVIVLFFMVGAFVLYSAVGYSSDMNDSIISAREGEITGLIKDVNPLNRQLTYQELIDLSQGMKSGKFNYTLRMDIMGSLKFEILVQSVKYGDASNTVTSSSILGDQTTSASYWINNKSITCKESSTDGKLKCRGTGATSIDAYFVFFNDISAEKMYHVNSRFLGKETLLGRSCSLFDVNLSAIETQKSNPLASSSSDDGNLTYLICLDDQYGFPLRIEVLEESYSKLIGETAKNSILTIELTGFSTQAEYVDVLPPKEVEFVIDQATCKKGIANVSILVLQRQGSYIINLSKYVYGKYDSQTRTYGAGGYRSIGLKQVHPTVDVFGSETFFVPYLDDSNQFSSPTLQVCGRIQCESQTCQNPTTITATGFARIKPQPATVSYLSDGSFEAVFTNGVGTRIRIVNASIITRENEHLCALTPAYAGVSAGENFKLVAFDCPKAEEGKAYDSIVKIVYEVSIGEVTTTHAIRGTIRGKVEGALGNPLECPRSYIRSGSGCCLDSDQDGTCDQLQAQSTTTNYQWTTSSSTTTTISSSFGYNMPKDKALCEKLSILHNDECYNQIAIKNKDPSMCQKISNNYKRLSCDAAVKAVKQEDITECDYLSGQYTTMWCQKEVSKYLMDPTLCKEITESSYSKYQCIEAVAALQKNELTCNLMPTSGSSLTKTTCQEKVQKATKGIKLCSELTGTIESLSTTTRQCYEDFILDAQDTAVCNTVTGDARDWCLRTAAILTDSKITCQIIKDAHIKNYCYRQVAINLNDEKVCDMMSATYGVESPASCKERLRGGGLAFCKPTDLDFTACLKNMLVTDVGRDDNNQ